MLIHLIRYVTPAILLDTENGTIIRIAGDKANGQVLQLEGLPHLTQQ